MQRLVQWASTEPLTAAALLARHNEAQGRGVHFNILVSELKRHGFVWKRTPPQSEKKRDPAAFEQARRDIAPEFDSLRPEKLISEGRGQANQQLAGFVRKFL